MVVTSMDIAGSGFWFFLAISLWRNARRELSDSQGFFGRHDTAMGGRFRWPRHETRTSGKSTRGVYPREDAYCIFRQARAKY